MGGLGGLIVGSALAIVVSMKAVFVSTIVHGNQLSATDVSAIIDIAAEWAYLGLRIGSMTLGSLTGIAGGIWLAYQMREETLND